MINQSETCQYVDNKLYLLRKCIDINKELLVSGDDIDSIASLIEHRGVILKTLNELGATTDQAIISGCSQAQKDSINRTVILLLDLDKELIENLSEHRAKMMTSIKNSVHSKKILRYGDQEVNSAGTYLNIKK